MFGQRLHVLKDLKVPRGKIILLVHPDMHLDVLNKAKAAFQRWSIKNPTLAVAPAADKASGNGTETEA